MGLHTFYFEITLFFNDISLTLYSRYTFKVKLMKFIYLFEVNAVKYSIFNLLKFISRHTNTFKTQTDSMQLKLKLCVVMRSYFILKLKKTVIFQNIV